jgi:heterotetrameric sarcosine oxidase gamma subunit
MTASPLRLTPLHAVGERLGATWIDIHGWRFARHFTSPEQEAAAVRAGVGLADSSPHGKILIEGKQAYEVLRAAYGAAPEAIGTHAAVESAGLYRLRPDLFYLSTSLGAEGPAMARIQAAIGEAGAFVTASDVTDGLADIRIIGPRAAEVLSRVCGLDFSDAAFPDLHARQTSLAKTRQLVIRRNFGPLPAWTTVGARSLGAYVWDVLLGAGRAFGMVPIGVATMRELETP